MTETAPAQPTETSKPAPSLGARILHNWVLPFLIALAVLSPIRSVIADWYDVPTGSMEPTILVGDRIAANKLAFGLRVPFTMKWLARWDEPEQGEVVILHSPADGTRMVKRVIAGPGDTVSLVRNRVHINDVETTYEPLTQAEVDSLPAEFVGSHEFATEKLATGDHTIMLTPNRAAMRTYGPVVVPDHMYFVMGDNRDNSGDSRVFGFVDRDLIVGRSSYVVLSLDRSNYYKPRFDRFFHPLD
jgi:signal peptidase I